MEKVKNNIEIKKIIDYLIRYRFLFSLIIFILLIVLKLHGSSIGMWDEYITEKINPSEKSLILGKNRAIRSDEWLVQSTYYFAQSMSDEYYPLNNYDITESGENMILSYNAPVFNITALGKPFNWGFFLLGKEYGLSWYWAFKTIGLLLLSFELAMVITKKMKALSLLSAFWITFSPGIQWWFMQHVGDVVFFALVMIISFHHYFEYHERKKIRLAASLIFSFSTVGFALILYPALQIPFGYLILMFMGIFFFNFIKKNKMDKIDLIFIPTILMIIGSLLGYFLITSKDAINLTMNTIYPGSRVSIGGGIELFRIGDFIVNSYMPFKDINYLNNCEVSSFINFLPGSIILLVVAIEKKCSDKIGIGLFIMLICQGIWTFISFPEWFAKITLLSYVPGSRMLLVFSFTSMIFSIWAIGVLFREKLILKKSGIVIATINIIFYIVLILTSVYKEYVSIKLYIPLFLIYLVINISIFCRMKKIFFVSMMCIIFISGMIVNPVARGVGSIYNKTLSRTIIQLSKEYPEGTWLSDDGILGSFIYANGAKTFNGIQFYPDMNKWKKVTDNKDDEFYYNRYAHVRVNLIEGETNFNLDSLDAFTVNLDIDKLKSLGIRFIVTKRDLNECFSQSYVKFNQLYYSSSDNIRVYELTQ